MKQQNQHNKITDSNDYPFYQYHDKKCIEYQGCGNVSASENDRKYIIVNKSKKEVVKYKIDGGLINDEEEIKCDYGFYTEDDVLFLVELKGGNYSHAINQIINTIQLLIKNPKIKISKINARIVASRVSKPEMRSSSEKKLKIILDGYHPNKDNLKKQSIQMTETL